MTITNKEKLAELLSEYAGISKEEGIKFLDSFCNVIVKNVKEGEDVEVPGLGTFNIIDTQQSEMRRVALHVSDSMKDEVNSPFSFFEPYKISQLAPVEPIVVIEEENSTPVVIENNDLETVSASDEIEEKTAEEKTTNVKTTSNKEESKKSKRIFTYTLFSILSLIVIACTYYIYTNNKVEVVEFDEETTRVEVKSMEKPKLIIDEDEIINEPSEIVPVSEVNLFDHRMKDENGSFVMVTLQQGERLTLISLNQFGSKDFWPYIYDVNTDKLKSPSQVFPGMKLCLPDPEFFNIDKNSETSLSAARKRGQELIKK